MDIPEDFTTFWSVNIKPGKHCRINIPDDVDLTITNAAVHQSDENPAVGRTVLHLLLNDKIETAVVPFIAGKFESTMIELHFDPKDHLDFYTTGSPASIDLCGYLCGGFAVDVNSES